MLLDTNKPDERPEGIYVSRQVVDEMVEQIGWFTIDKVYGNGHVDRFDLPREEAQALFDQLGPLLADLTGET